MNRTTCRSCGADVIWVVTQAGKRMPVYANPRPDGNLVLENGVACFAPPASDGSTSTRYVSHFVTCPQHREWRRSP